MRVFLRWLNVFCALALIGSLTATAMAQQVPLQVVQGSDGTLYLVQGNNSWTLVPNQISDDALASLNPNGEVDGTIPNDLLIVQAPTASPAPAPAAPVTAPAPPTPTPPTPTSVPAAITGTADLTGKVPSDIPGTLIAVGATITSIVDSNTKPRDVYAVSLSPGVTYQFLFTLAPGVGVHLLNPDSSEAFGGYALTGRTNLNCNTGSTAFGPPCALTPAASGTYYLQITAAGSGQRYTFTIRQQ